MQHIRYLRSELARTENSHGRDTHQPARADAVHGTTSVGIPNSHSRGWANPPRRRVFGSSVEFETRGRAAFDGEKEGFSRRYATSRGVVVHVMHILMISPSSTTSVPLCCPSKTGSLKPLHSLRIAIVSTHCEVGSQREQGVCRTDVTGCHKVDRFVSRFSIYSPSFSGTASRSQQMIAPSSILLSTRYQQLSLIIRICRHLKLSQPL